jgi:toxin ParE1/3/4
MPRVLRTPQARDDLVDIIHALARWSIPAAQRARTAIERTIRLLAQSPLLGRERPELKAGLFSYPVSGRYLLFYRLNADGISLIRVLYGAQDITSDMFEE